MRCRRRRREGVHGDAGTQVFGYSFIWLFGYSVLRHTGMQACSSEGRRASGGRPETHHTRGGFQMAGPISALPSAPSWPSAMHLDPPCTGLGAPPSAVAACAAALSSSGDGSAGAPAPCQLTPWDHSTGTCTLARTHSTQKMSRWHMLEHPGGGPSEGAPVLTSSLQKGPLY